MNGVDGGSWRAGKGKVPFTEPLNHLSISDSVIMGLLLKACKRLISPASVDKRLGFSPREQKMLLEWEDALPLRLRFPLKGTGTGLGWETFGVGLTYP